MIRRATASDALAIGYVEQAAFADGAERPWSERALRATLSSPDTAAWVATADRVVAWVGFRRIVDEFELLRVAVDPNSRRRGHGRRLIEHGLDRFRADGASVVHLEVRDGNTAAIALYEGLGFHIVGRRPGYYAGGVDALTMKLPLRHLPTDA